MARTRKELKTNSLKKLNNTRYKDTKTGLEYSKRKRNEYNMVISKDDTSSLEEEYTYSPLFIEISLQIEYLPSHFSHTPLLHLVPGGQKSSLEHEISFNISYVIFI